MRKDIAISAMENIKQTVCTQFEISDTGIETNDRIDGAPAPNEDSIDPSTSHRDREKEQNDLVDEDDLNEGNLFEVIHGNASHQSNH